MPFYRYIPDVVEIEGVETPLPVVIPVNYHEEQVSWAYLQEGGYFFLLEGDFRYMMERRGLTVRLSIEGDEADGLRLAALELIPLGTDV